MDPINPSLEALQDIRKMMDRSSRFISLSGWSGICAGVIALVASYIAYDWITELNNRALERGSMDPYDYQRVIISLILLGVVTMVAALLACLFFTWKKTKNDQVPLFDRSSKRLVINLFIPLVAGGAFVLGMLYQGSWQFVASACLIFYGLALVNASKYTYSDVRYVGMIEIALGIVALFNPGNGLYFWALGFGVIHILYGIFMWWKYERNPKAKTA